jgi:hypothetical protein
MSVPFSSAMFELLLNQAGVEITVITRTPQIEDGEVQKNSKGNIIYDETTSTVTGRILEMTGTEAYWQGTIAQGENNIGLFRLSDADLLNENSRITYNGRVMYMKRPVMRFTHIEVPLMVKDV